MAEKGKTLAELARLRDEIRDRLHRAGGETKKWWEEVEPQLAQVEANLVRGSEKAVEVSKTVAEEFAAAFQRIRDRVTSEDSADKQGDPPSTNDDVVDAEIESDPPEG